MQAIIERTAVFVAKQGKQMEILVKAKQSGNPQFDFLLMDNWLNPYYQQVLRYVTEGKYIPIIEKQPLPQPREEAEESASEEESDGEYELHPLLQASLHKKVTRSQPSSASSSPLPDPLGNKFSRTFAPVSGCSLSNAAAQEHDGGHYLHYSEVDEAFDYSMWYPPGMYDLSLVISTCVHNVNQGSKEIHVHVVCVPNNIDSLHNKLAKIRQYSARLSRIIVLFTNCQTSSGMSYVR